MVARTQQYDAVIATPLGRVGILLQDNALCSLDFLPPRTALKRAKTALTARISMQLRAYFKLSDMRFEIPLVLHGTEFQQRVWRALTRIPPGKTLTYGDLAAKLGSGARAVGSACRENPVPIIIPCHRVVARSGMGGYMGQRAGKAMQIKLWLLAHEQQ